RLEPAGPPPVPRPDPAGRRAGLFRAPWQAETPARPGRPYSVAIRLCARRFDLALPPSRARRIFPGHAGPAADQQRRFPDAGAAGGARAGAAAGIPGLVRAAVRHAGNGDGALGNRTPGAACGDAAGAQPAGPRPGPHRIPGRILRPRALGPRGRYRSLIPPSRYSPRILPAPGWRRGTVPRSAVGNPAPVSVTQEVPGRGGPAETSHRDWRNDGSERTPYRSAGTFPGGRDRRSAQPAGIRPRRLRHRTDAAAHG